MENRQFELPLDETQRSPEEILNAVRLRYRDAIGQPAAAAFSAEEIEHRLQDPEKERDRVFRENQEENREDAVRTNRGS